MSLWQPWATLWVLGLKVHETRSWPTRHRGPLLVHAAKSRGADYQAAAVWEKLAEHGYGVLGVPRGRVVGAVWIEDCLRTHELDLATLPDLAFGDFSPGRYAWRARAAVGFAEPFEWRGGRGFFEVDLRHNDGSRPDHDAVVRALAAGGGEDL